MKATGQLSPDGRWLAYVPNESGRDEVFVQPFAIESFGKASDGSSMLHDRQVAYFTRRRRGTALAW